MPTIGDLQKTVESFKEAIDRIPVDSLRKFETALPTVERTSSDGQMTTYYSGPDYLYPHLSTAIEDWIAKQITPKGE